MVTYCVTKIIPTCSPMIGQFFDTMIVASTDRVVIMTHQTLRLGKCWKLFRATLNSLVYHRNIFGSSSKVFGNYRKSSDIFGNFRKFSENVRKRSSGLRNNFENLRKSSEGGRKSSENHQKRRHQHVYIIKKNIESEV